MKFKISMASIGVIASLFEFHHSRDIWALISAGWAFAIIVLEFTNWLERYAAREEARHANP